MSIRSCRCKPGRGHIFGSIIVATVPDFPECPVLAKHPRSPWPPRGCEVVLVHGRLDVLQGTSQGLGADKKKVAAAYARAKAMNDMEAAFDLVDMLYSDPIEDQLVDRIMAGGKVPIFLSPHPSFDDEHTIDFDAPIRTGPRNALPFAYAARLQVSLGGEVDTDIVQAARVGRSKLNRFQRFLWQPNFVGDVRTDRPYIIVDDAFAIGGTLAALAGHIMAGGGTLIAATALAHPSGQSVPFALTDRTLRLLQSEYGAGFDSFWKEAIGHEATCLTEVEGAFLVQWAQDQLAGHRAGNQKLLALRDRLLKARDQGE